MEVGFFNCEKRQGIEIQRAEWTIVHTSLDCHINAIVAWAEYKRMQFSSTSVGQILNEAHQRAVEENRYQWRLVHKSCRAAARPYALNFFFFFSLRFEVLSPNFFKFLISFHVLIIYEYKFLNGISVLPAAQVFSFANEPNGDAMKY